MWGCKREEFSAFYIFNELIEICSKMKLLFVNLHIIFFSMRKVVDVLQEMYCAAHNYYFNRKEWF